MYIRIQLTTPLLDQTKEELEGELQTLARADLMRRRVALANPANRIIQVLSSPLLRVHSLTCMQPHAQAFAEKGRQLKLEQAFEDIFVQAAGQNARFSHLY